MPAKRSQQTKRVPLSRERIAKAGLELADREGVDGLSMRRLAERLGVGTMTLYGHFRDKQELLDAVNDAAVAEAEVPRLRGSWRQRIHQLIAHSRELFARHPCVVEIWARQPVLGTGALRWVEAGLETLEGAGFEPEDAVKAFRLLVVYTYGFTLFSRPRSDAIAHESTRAALASLPEELYPRLREAAGPFAAAMAGEDAFAFGLDRILDGFEASLRKR